MRGCKRAPGLRGRLAAAAAATPTQCGRAAPRRRPLAGRGLAPGAATAPPRVRGRARRCTPQPPPPPAALARRRDPLIPLLPHLFAPRRPWCLASHLTPIPSEPHPIKPNHPHPQSLAAEVASYLGTELGKIKIKRFADGEIYVQVRDLGRSRNGVGEGDPGGRRPAAVCGRRGRGAAAGGGGRPPEGPLFVSRALSSRSCSSNPNGRNRHA